jgi:hypothetical protein
MGSVRSGFTAMNLKNYCRSHWRYIEKRCYSFCDVRCALFLAVGETIAVGPHAE